MKEMRILIGLPASGKSKYAKELVASDPLKWERVNWDDLRHAEPDWKFSREREKAMQQRSFDIARNAFAQGKSVIVDNTNLHPRAADKWKRIAHECGAHWSEHSFLHVPVEECVRRDALRTGRDHVGRYVIERMALFNGLLSFPENKSIVIVDMDGTLADCEHRRPWIQQKPKNYDEFYARCIDDPPIDIVVRWVQALCSAPEFVVCIVSGRPLDRAGAQTVQWLALHNVQFDHIFMRNSGDFRPDFEIKQEILDKLPKERIAFCIDDRNQVVDMWRKNGLSVIQVAEGNF